MKKLILTAAVVCWFGFSANAQTSLSENPAQSGKLTPAAPAVNDDGTIKESVKVVESQPASQPASQATTADERDQKKKPATKAKKEETATKPN